MVKLLCQICKKREATIHFTNVENNKVYEIHLCAQCAKEKGFEKLKKSNFAMSDIIAELLNSTARRVDEKLNPNTCPNCGTTFLQFKKSGRLGCSECYSFFNRQLIPLLRGIHGNTRHVGKVPKKYKTKVNKQRRVLELEEELARAIELEEYERAAQIRDEIRSLREAETRSENN